MQSLYIGIVSDHWSVIISDQWFSDHWFLSFAYRLLPAVVASSVVKTEGLVSDQWYQWSLIQRNQWSLNQWFSDINDNWCSNLVISDISDSVISGLWGHCSLQTTSEIKYDLRFEISDLNYLLILVHIAYVVWTLSTASEATTASKHPRRSDMTSDLNSVTSITCISMCILLICYGPFWWPQRPIRPPNITSEQPRRSDMT